MNGAPSTATGMVLRVQFNGAGLNSGEIGISLDNGQSYWVFMDTPAGPFLEIFETAVTAMWKSKKVEIKYIRRDNGDWGVVSIRKI